LAAIVQSKQAMVNEYAGQLVADRLVDQDRSDRAIDATPPPPAALPLADLFADLGTLRFAIGRHRPVAFQPTHAMDEVGDQFRSVRRVSDLGMELGAVELPLLVGDHRKRRAVADGDDVEAWREGGD